MLKDRGPSQDLGSLEYNQRFRERELQSLQKQAPTLGYTLALAERELQSLQKQAPTLGYTLALASCQATVRAVSE